MKTFLAEVVQHIIAKKEPLENTVLVLPSKRAGTFVKHYFLKTISNTTFAPTILSIEDFIASVSGLRYAQDAELLFIFYQTYQKLTPAEKQDSFYAFLKWAPVLLQDFNEIDRHLADPEKIFSYLSAIQDLNHWSLQPEKTVLQQNYLAFWEHLPDYYQTLTEFLLQKGLGYQGLVYREAVDTIEFYIQNNQDRFFYFIGFNALNKAEDRIIQELLQQTTAEIFWDTDRFFLEDPIHEAGFFIRKHLNSWNYFREHSIKWVTSHFTTPKNIQVIGMAKNVSQANYIGKILEDLSSNSKKNLLNTAVILGDESLLNATLFAIPESVGPINITMGAPLQHTAFASFLDVFFQLLISGYSEKGWYYKKLFPLLVHPITQKLLLKEHIALEHFIRFIKRNNLIYIVPETLLERIKGLSVLLEFDNNLIGALSVIHNIRNTIQTLKANHDPDDHGLFLEHLYRFAQLFNELKDLKHNYPFLGSIKELHAVYKQLVRTQTLDYQGEPLQGLQLMGVLESRNLDFETVIISSVNEGILPAGKTNNSFIPYDVKKSFQLPTYQEKDAIYAYHFYRLLQRAKSVYILYNTEPDVLRGGEKSRFIQQLIQNKPPEHSLTHQLASPELHIAEQSLRTIVKEESLIDELKALAERGFSPSSITNYIRNPNDFYVQNVLGIKQTDVIEETIAANTLGTVVHETLERLYTPYIGNYLDPELVHKMAIKAPQMVSDIFKKVYRSEYYNKGKNLLILKVAQEFVQKFLKQEETVLRAGNQIKILSLETPLTTNIQLENGQQIKLKGVVDRLDTFNGTIRVIDYKTGKVAANELRIHDWNLLIGDYKYSKVFQVLSYAYLLYKNGEISLPVEAGIMSFRNLNEGFLNFAVKKNVHSRNMNTLVTKEILDNYESVLKVLLTEIFNPEVPFTEKEISTRAY